MKKIVGYLLILLTMAISACHSQPAYDSRLLLADSIMQHRPDSALALLRNLNASDLSSEADVALHALLLSHAYDKNYIDLTNDSLISIAVDYFSEGNEPRYAMLAYYYHACVLFNAQKYSDCVLACMKAELSAKQISDDFYLGMIYRHLLFVHNATYNFSEALSYAQKSYTHFKASGKELYSRWALKDLAVSYHNNSQCSKSLELFYEVIKIAHQSQDSVFLSDALSLYTVILGQAKKYDDALSIVDSLYASAQPKTSFEYSSFSFIYAKCGDVAKAGMCLTKSCDLASTLNDSLSIEYAWRQLARVSKDSVEYYKHQYKIANFRNKQYTDSTKIAIAAARLFFNKRNMLAPENKKAKCILLILFAISFCLYCLFETGKFGLTSSLTSFMTFITSSDNSAGGLFNGIFISFFLNIIFMLAEYIPLFLFFVIYPKGNFDKKLKISLGEYNNEKVR